MLYIKNYISGVFSEEENQFILDNYEMMTQPEIAKHLNRKVASVKDRISKLGLSKVPKKFWTKEEINTLKRIWHRENDYMSYFPDRTEQSVMYKAFELGLKRDGRGMFDVNHDYFKEINEKNAYVLGLITADGNIFKSLHRLTIYLHRNDKYMLENIKKDMGLERDIVDRRKVQVSELVVTSREMTDDLNRYGIYDNKSLNQKEVDVPPKYMSHFVRGYFDGDGCVVSYKRERPTRTSQELEASFLGTTEFLLWMGEEVAKQTGLHVPSINKTHSKIYSMKYSGGSALTLADWMYNNKNFYLTRKLKRFKTYKADISQS